MRTTKQIAEAIPAPATLPEYRRHLVYIDQGDGMSAGQVEEVLRSGYSESTDEWANESQWMNACELADELFEETADDEEYDALKDDWLCSDEREALIEQIREADSSDPTGDLMNSTGVMLFRVSPDEDHMPFLDEELDDPTMACEALGLDPEFLDVVTEILPEISGYRAEGGAHFGVTVVFSANPGELRDFQEGERVNISDPFIWLTNPWSGNGYGVQATGKMIAVIYDDIHVDAKAWGYSADDVFGGLCIDESTLT